MEQEKLNRVRRAVKERQDKLKRVALVQSMMRSTYCNAHSSEINPLDKACHFTPDLFNDKLTADTAVHLFIEHLYEDFAEYITEDEYFYYLCDFTEHCKSIGIKFPDTSHLECYD